MGTNQIGIRSEVYDKLTDLKNSKSLDSYGAAIEYLFAEIKELKKQLR